MPEVAGPSWLWLLKQKYSRPCVCVHACTHTHVHSLSHMHTPTQLTIIQYGKCWTPRRMSQTAEWIIMPGKVWGNDIPAWSWESEQDYTKQRWWKGMFDGDKTWENLGWLKVLGDEGGILLCSDLSTEKLWGWVWKSFLHLIFFLAYRITFFIG